MKDLAMVDAPQGEDMDEVEDMEAADHWNEEMFI